MTAIRPPLIAADHIRELTMPTTTTEHIDRLTLNTRGRWTKTWALHTVTHPPLLDQLTLAITSSHLNDTEYRAGYESKPAARLDALDTLARIDHEAHTYATQLGASQTGTLKVRLWAISGIVGHRHDHTVHGWWTAARIATGWDTPPYRPNRIPCPIETCEQRGTLRIHLADQTGICTNCGTQWDPSEIGLLGQWVMWASEHLNGPRHLILEPTTLELVECPECAMTRQAMSDRAHIRDTRTRQETTA